MRRRKYILVRYFYKNKYVLHLTNEELFLCRLVIWLFDILIRKRLLIKEQNEYFMFYNSTSADLVKIAQFS